MVENGSLFRTDNMAVADIVADIYSREPHLIHLVRLLVLLASLHGFWFTSKHIPGVENGFADAISRDNASFFLSQVPQAAQNPSHVLMALITWDQPWTSTAWMAQFDSTSQLL